MKHSSPGGFKILTLSTLASLAEMSSLLNSAVVPTARHSDSPLKAMKVSAPTPAVDSSPASSSGSPPSSTDRNFDFPFPLPFFSFSGPPFLEGWGQSLAKWPS